MLSPFDTTHSSRPVLARKRTSERGTSEHGLERAESPSDSLDGKGKTRARINMACIHCRHRKIKCDGAQPSCSTCVRLRRECEYEPVTEYENLISRERKRRNKEKKLARIASLGIFAGQSPLSMLHAGAALGMPSAPLAHHNHYVGDMSQQDLAPLFLQMPDPRLQGHSVDSQFGPRRRRGISDTRATTMQHRFGPLTSPLPQSPFQNASVSQPPTPAQAYRYYQSLAVSPAQQHVGSPNAPVEFYPGPLSAPLVPSVTAGPFFDLNQPTTPSFQHQQQTMTSPHVVDLMGLSTASSMPAFPSGRANATEADFDLGLVDLTGVPTMAPTSAHVRPIDLPAPHGHDFAGIPFPTQDAFTSELPIAALRRRSSIHLPVSTSDAFFRRPSVAEVATAALMQKVADKRFEKVNTDVKELAKELLSTDSTGIVAWNAHVQSQMPASMAAWSGFQSAVSALGIKHESNHDYVVPTMPASRSNSDGPLSLGPLSPPAPLIGSGLVKEEQGVEVISATSSCSVSSSTGDSSIQAEVPMLEHSYFAIPGGKVSRDISPFALSPTGSSPPSSLIAQEAWTGFRTDNLPLLSPASKLNANFNSLSVFANPTSTSVQQPQSGKQEEVLLDSNSLSMAFGHDVNF
ncbi:uncharacterized protein UDID_01548 [Ustilago sp. UG-2017a]|nr:uncharacterized protein UDID_01548 [Ustilago sp. UG-2017a]